MKKLISIELSVLDKEDCYERDIKAKRVLRIVGYSGVENKAHSISIPDEWTIPEVTTAVATALCAVYPEDEGV